MRLGEIKQMLDQVTNDEYKMILESEPRYGGQAHLVSNYGAVLTCLDILVEFDWNSTDFAAIETLQAAHPATQKSTELSQEEFNQLNTYIASLNDDLPFFCSILSTMVEDQDEKTINIKLSSKIDSLSDLSTVNKRLETTLKLFNVDGQFEFKGFDKGSNWYIVIPLGFMTYQCIIHGLDIAKKFFETREAYFKSKDAELEYRASLKDQASFDDAEFEEYKTRKLELILEEKVSKAVEKIKEMNGKSQHELHTQLVHGVQALVKELGEGTEFHLSLNPPEYVEGDVGRLIIDYKKIQQIRAEEAKKVGDGETKVLASDVVSIEPDKVEVK